MVSLRGERIFALNGFMIRDGDLKRHAGSLSWEIQVGAGPSSQVGIHGATPTSQRASADQAVATDLASVITLTNKPRAALAETGLIRGGA